MALERLPWVGSLKKADTKKAQGVELVPVLFQLERLLTRFYLVARQLECRYNNRETLRIDDEYDVQDLLHALLKTMCDDVRPEDVAPTRAGASSRVDFLLKTERIVVEVKMASFKLQDKQIGEQLIVDIERYKSHPDCSTLFCFVYDPGHHIANPVGLETDLSRKHDNLAVRVLVIPR